MEPISLDCAEEDVPASVLLLLRFQRLLLSRLMCLDAPLEGMATIGRPQYCSGYCYHLSYDFIP